MARTGLKNIGTEFWDSSRESAGVFRNRNDAGRKLAKRLLRYANRDDVIVLGIPRGGVVVAHEVASILGAELDVCVSRKLGVPGQEELAFGAISTGGACMLDEGTVEALGISAEGIERVMNREKAELERRELLYRGNRPPLKLEGRIVILVDDGIATGASMLAAVEALRQLKPARIVVAVPAASLRACKDLESKVDEIVCPMMPESFYAVGQSYEDFSQVEDQEVAELLQGARQSIERKGSALNE